MTELSFGRVEEGAGNEKRRGKRGSWELCCRKLPRLNKTIRQYEHDMTQYECVFFFCQTLESKIQYYPARLPSPHHSAPCRSVGNDSSHYSQLTWRRLRSFGFCSSSLLLPRPFALFPSPLHTKTKSTRVFTALRTNETADNKAGKCCSGAAYVAYAQQYRMLIAALMYA